MSILGDIVGAVAHILHPDRPRDVLQNVHIPTDLTEEEVMQRMNAAAAKNPQFKNWRTSIKDRMKLTHPDNPDEAASDESLARLSAELGRPSYSGTYEQNVWLLAQTDIALRQRGIPLPAE